MSLASLDALLIERSAELKESSHSRIYWLFVSYLIHNYALSHIAASQVAAFSYLGGALVLARIYVTERR